MGDRVGVSAKDPDSDRLQRSICQYGPFTLSLPIGMSALALDDDLSGSSWLKVGLIIDPADHAHDQVQIARLFDAYIAWVVSRTGDQITLYGKDIAPAIVAQLDPVLLPLWRELQ